MVGVWLVVSLPRITGQRQRYICPMMFRVADSSKQKLLLSVPNLGCLFRYSTSPTSTRLHSISDYLVDQLGFSKDEAVSTSIKGTRLKSLKKADFVVNYFQECGLDKSQIRRMVSNLPGLLACKVDKTLKPKYQLLQDLGMSQSDIGKVISCNPYFFCAGLDTDIVPSVDYLREVLGSDEIVVKVIKRYALFLSYSASKRMPPNVLLLQKWGLSNDNIRKFIVNHPRYVLREPGCLDGVMHQVEKEFGIPRSSRMFIYGLMVYVSLNKSTIETKVGIFRSFGWDESNIATMIKKLPLTLRMSGAKVRGGLNYFMNELGYSPGYLASHPCVLMFDLKKRVMPRNTILLILKSKKLVKDDLSLYSVVTASEMDFVRRYLQPNKCEIPDIYEAYLHKLNGIIKNDQGTS